MRLISIQVESSVLRRHKLLKRLLDVNLSPEEAQALMQRVKMNPCSADDRDRFVQVMRATTEVTDQLLAPSPLLEPPTLDRASLPGRKAKRKRQLAKASRRRNRREGSHGLT